jgi:hypothetical protein
MSRARDFADLASSADAGGITGKNLIINGAMQVAQRGTSTTSVSGGGYHACDRWDMTVSGRDEALFTVSQNTSNIVDGFSNSFKIETTTAESAIAADEYFIARQKVEAQNLQHLQYATSGAKSTTLSFWVKSSVAATFSVYLYKPDTTARVIGGTYTISSTNTWEYKTITFAGDTDSGATINDDNGIGVHVAWVLAVGSNYTSTDNTSWADYVDGRLAYGHAGNAVVTTTNATWEITGVQLEVGEQATPFEHRSYGDELARCQRYFQIIPSNSGAYTFPLVRHRSATNSYSGSSYYPVTMRTNATMTLDTAGTWIHKPNTRQDTGSATVVSSSPSVFTVIAIPSTDDSTQYLAFSNNNVEADAEL